MKSKTSIPETKTTSSGSRPIIGIAFRIALMSWLLAMMTLIIFILVINPEQRKTYIDQLESKANSVGLSLQEATASAAINEDYASVINTAKRMIEGDSSVDFLIVMRNDGFSLIIERKGWRVEEKADAYWLDRDRVTSGKIATVPHFDRRVFHYAKPFDYSGIQWGWIHVGLSLKDYNRSIAELTKNMLLTACGCIILSLLISWFYSRQVVRPVLRLRGVVRKIAGGDLSVRVRMQVEDNGVGISRENLTRIFQHGFTTKKNGCGFGLHSGALAARKLGGSLCAYSNGPGLGATFTLEIPFTSGGKE